MTAAAHSKERLTRLYLLRDQLTSRLDADPSHRDFALLSGHLRDTLAQIEQCERLNVGPRKTPLDELQAKRAQRGAAGADRPARTAPRRRG